MQAAVRETFAHRPRKIAAECLDAAGALAAVGTLATVGVTEALIVLVVTGLLIIAAFLVRQRRTNRSLQRSEAALAASRERLRTITDNVPAVVAHVDQGERYTFSNGYLQQLYRLSDAQILGRTLRQIHGEEA